MKLIAQVVVEGEGQALHVAAYIKPLVPKGIQFKLVHDLADGDDYWDILFYGERASWFVLQLALKDMKLSDWQGVLAVNMQ